MTVPDLSIQLLIDRGCVEIAAAFSAIGWNKPQAQYERHLAEQRKGERTVLVARSQGEFVGYLTIHWRSNYEPFRNQNIPEITDLNVLPSWQRRGIATCLMEEAEARIREASPVAGIGVGMDPDYGPAQRMYALRGYIPDGLGLTYEGKHVHWGDIVRVNDSLVLMLTKRLID